MNNRERLEEIAGKMEKGVWCSWQLLLGALLAMVCMSCRPAVAPVPRQAPPPPPVARPEEPVQHPTFYVKVGRLNLRAGPGMDFPKLGLLDRNEEVEKVGEAENWYQIRVKRDGTLGWVSSEYLSSTPVSSPIQTPVPETPVAAPAAKEKEVPPPPPAEPKKPKPAQVEPSAPAEPKPAEAAEPPARKAKRAVEEEPPPAPVPKAVQEKPAPKREEPPPPPPPSPPAPEEKPSGIRIM